MRPEVRGQRSSLRNISFVRHLSLPGRPPLCLSPFTGVTKVLSSSLCGFISLLEIVDILEDDDSLDDNLGLDES